MLVSRNRQVVGRKKSQDFAAPFVCPTGAFVSWASPGGAEFSHSPRADQGGAC